MIVFCYWWPGRDRNNQLDGIEKYVILSSLQQEIQMKTWFYIKAVAGYGEFMFAVRADTRDDAMAEFKSKFPDVTIVGIVTRKTMWEN
jgi:hypothetical protein